MTSLFLDIGTGELLIIVALAVVLLGPEKVPPLAKKAARVVRFLKQVANNATSQIKAELGSDYEDLSIEDLKPRNLVQQILPDEKAELSDLRAELDNMRTEVARLQLQTGAALKRAPLPSPEAVASTESPPDAQSTTQRLVSESLSDKIGGQPQ